MINSNLVYLLYGKFVYNKTKAIGENYEELQVNILIWTIKQIYQ